MEVENPLHRAAAIVGSATALAAAIGRAQSTISEWMVRGWAAPDACADIAAAVRGEVTEAELLKSAATLKKAARDAALAKKAQGGQQDAAA